MVLKLILSILFIFLIILVYLFIFLYQLTLIKNYIGYKIVKGNRLNADELRSIFQGLLANELLEYDYILTGYCYNQVF